MKHLATACLALALTAGPLLAQQPADDGAAANGDLEQVKKDIAELKDDVAELKKVAARVDRIEQEDLTTIAQDLQTITNALNQLSMDVIPELNRSVRDQEARLGDISEQDGDRYIPTILGNMRRSQTFRRQMMRATKGTVLFDNKTGVSWDFRVNGDTYSVQPGPSQLEVPLGRLTTQLLYYESPRVWTTDDWTYNKENDRFERRITIGWR